jgi:YD repeat-containing protein
VRGDQNGNRTTYAYDDADRLISVTDAQSPTAGVTRYVYDTENNLTDIYDAGGWPTLCTTPESAAPPFAVFEGWAPLPSA